MSAMLAITKQGVCGWEQEGRCEQSRRKLVVKRVRVSKGLGLLKD